jgi:hypothetical protein
VIVVAAALVAASAGIGTYLWVRSQAQSYGPTSSEGLQALPVGEVTASNNSNGPGGCSAPGLGLTEYCYTFVMDHVAMIGGVGPGAHAEDLEYETTADVTFLVLSGPGASNVSYENITLLSAPGRILATYTAGLHWSAYGGDSLPVVLWSNESLLLNLGTTPAASSDYFEFEEGPWGASGCGFA